MKKIILEDENGNVVNSWPSMSAAAIDLKVCNSTIANVVYGRVKKSPLIPGILYIDDDNARKYDPSKLFVNLEGEIWKTINGCSNYEISSCGRLRRKSDYKILKCNTGTYPHCTLIDDNGIKVNKYVHRLVAEHFLPDWDPTLIVNHKDENKYNNHVSNLEMMTQGGNMNYSRNLHKEEWVEKTKRIRNNSYSKAVSCIENGIVIDSISQASKASDIGASQISGCCKGRYLTAGGLHWEYVEEQDNNK